MTVTGETCLDFSFQEIHPIRVQLHGTLYCGKWPFYHGKLHLVSMTNISGGKFSAVNTYGYIKKITCSALDISCDQLHWCFDVQGITSKSRFSVCH